MYSKDLFSVGLTDLNLSMLFDSHNNHFIIKDCPYENIYQFDQEIYKLKDSLLNNTRNMFVFQSNEKKDIYLTDFIYINYRGIDDYTNDILQIANNLIEFELYLDENKNNIELTSSKYYLMSTHALSLMYDILSQIASINQEMLNGTEKRPWLHIKSTFKSYLKRLRNK